MQRYKRIFGNTMKARALPQQKTEAWISASALNRMTSLGGCPRIGTVARESHFESDFLVI
jgi:hypothetical protein